MSTHCRSQQTCADARGAGCRVRQNTVFEAKASCAPAGDWCGALASPCMVCVAMASVLPSCCSWPCMAKGLQGPRPPAQVSRRLRRMITMRVRLRQRGSRIDRQGERRARLRTQGCWGAGPDRAPGRKHHTSLKPHTHRWSREQSGQLCLCLWAKSLLCDPSALPTMGHASLLLANDRPGRALLALAVAARLERLPRVLRAVRQHLQRVAAALTVVACAYCGARHTT